MWYKYIYIWIYSNIYSTWGNMHNYFSIFIANSWLIDLIDMCDVKSKVITSNIFSYLNHCLYQIWKNPPKLYIILQSRLRGIKDWEMERHKDGGMGRWGDGWMDRWTDRRTDGWTDRQRERRTDTDRRTDRQKMDGWTDKPGGSNIHTLNFVEGGIKTKLMWILAYWPLFDSAEQHIYLK